MTPQTIEPQQLLDICANEKREGRGEFCPFCAAAQTILDLKAALAHTEQERDAVIFLRGARAKAVAEGLAQGRADTLAQVTPLVVDLSELVELWMNGILKDIGVNWIDPPPALQRAKTWLTLPVSPSQENTP